MVSRRAYSSDSSTRLWSNNLTLLDSRGLESALDAEEQALLRAVWQHGAEKAPLPKHLETIRRKYKMDSLDYRYYWRYVAGSMMTPRIPGAYDKARNFLRRLDKGKGYKHVLLAEDREQNLSRHLRLMIEAKNLRRENEARERGEEASITDIDGSAELPTVPQQKQKMSHRQKWRLNKEWAGLQMRRRAIIEERVVRLAKKQMSVANAVQELERQRKIRNLSERQADVRFRIRNLLETLAIDEDKQREAKEAREEAHKLAEEREERREGLDHVLDDALTIAGLSEGAADINPTKDAVNLPALLSKFDLNADTKTLQRQIQELEGRLSASYPRMDTMPYVISLSENRNTLQTWLRILGKRLKSRDDNVDEWSEEKTEVKAVLDQMVRDHDLNNEAARRMAKRWEDIVQKRAGVLDEVDDEAELEVEEVEAAEKMSLAARGAELGVETEKSSAETTPATEVDEELDMDEFDAGGMSFLNADEVELDVDMALVGSDVPPEPEVPLAAQDTELDVETAESVEEAEPSTEVEEELEQVGMKLVTDEPAQFSNLEDFRSRKGGKASANPLITPSRKQNDMVDDFIAQRLYSTSSRPPLDPSLAPSTSTSTTESSPSTPAAKATTPSSSPPKPHLPHLTPSGSAHMVSVSAKAHTIRTAIAVGTVHFSNPTPLSLISSASLKKGDVLAVSRIAGIMAAKKCPDLIPLCHPIPLTHVGVELRVLDASASGASGAHSTSTAVGSSDMPYGGVTIEAKVQCTGPTGVEMEALTAVMGAALSVVDMCKAVDKFQRVQDVRVVLKEGGKSGVWREEGWESDISGGEQ